MFGIDPKVISDGMAKIDSINAACEDIQRRLAAIEAKLGLPAGSAPENSQPTTNEKGG